MRRIMNLVFVAALVAAPLSAATFTVTTTNDSGAGSLRQAITDANGNAGPDTIAFDVSGAGCDGSGVCTITTASLLPTISSPVVIDGYTQPGSSPNTNAQGALNTVLKVVLSGANLGQPAIVVSGTGAGSTVRGLVINGGFGDAFTSFLSDGDTLAGCFIGTDVSGTAAVPNARAVYAQLTPNFRLGGPSPADRNLISGNSQSGVAVFNSADSLIEANLIGTDITGAARLGNNGDGIYVGTNSPGTVIRGNVIADAHWNGMQVGYATGTTHGSTVEGNWIGTDVTGTLNLGNAFRGVVVLGQQNAVGGIGPGEGNVIAFNGLGGVYVDDWATGIFGNPIRGNSIYANGCLGIDFGDVLNDCEPTSNDLGDADTGPNELQNFPMITSAVSSLVGGGTTTVTGRLNGHADTMYTLDFYSSPACVDRPQAFLQGRTYLDSEQVTTDGSGNAAIDAVLPVTLAPGEKVTATATDPDGNTSEFSQRIVLHSAPGSGPPTGAIITLSGFHFLPGATVTVGGVPASEVNVASYNQITATAPSLESGSLNDVTLTNTDGTSGTLPNGWIADFLDVPGNNQFYTNVTTLVRNAITAGVGNGSYGVAQDTKRQQMAVFLLKAKYGICYTPPPCTVQAFPDVPCSSNFAPWINELVAQGITSGCGGGLYCPLAAVNRQQMAVFLLKTLEGSGYAPPACTVATFTDVPCESNFAPWIYELVARNITAGCGGGNYCPLTSATRGQMAVFIVKMFSLQ